MAKENNLHDLLFGIGEAIRIKGGRGGEINPQDFEQRIKDLPSDIDLTQIGLSQATEDAFNLYIMNGIDYAKKMQKEYIQGRKYTQDKSIVFVPKLPLEEISLFHSMFLQCSNILYSADIIAPKATNMQQLFESCYQLREVGDIVAPNNTTTLQMFSGCRSLVKAPKSLDFTNVTNARSTFLSCELLNELPNEINLQNCEDASSLFYKCYSLKEINLKNISNIKKISEMFRECRSLQYVRANDFFNNVESMNTLLWGSHYIEEIPKINTDKVKSLTNFAYSCAKLKKVELTSVENITNFDYSFLRCLALTVLIMTRYKQTNLSLADSPNLTPLSIHNIIVTALGKDEGATQRTLTLHATAKANWKAAYPDDEAMAAEKLITIA